MKKILLIEDRTERQKKFTEETDFDFDNYTEILDNKTILNKESLEGYSTIITHRSAFGKDNKNTLDFLKDYCADSKVNLVFFSGGITATYYTQSTFEFLLLNSKSFYGSNLKLFLEEAKNSEPNLLLLAYGENWQVNIMLNTLSKINLFIASAQAKEAVIAKLRIFERKTEMNMLKGIIDTEYLSPDEKGNVAVSKLEKFAEDVSKKIAEKVELHA